MVSRISCRWWPSNTSGRSSPALITKSTGIIAERMLHWLMFDDTMFISATFAVDTLRAQ